ncbi:hypothetical protein ElyMa_006588700 [Elysia marginata]|uniref:Uncharacterized protein n=1 Tax=Elysia marginata TaxID=1093978 RepID=A0AAV4IIR3_9GAST|nr:hypothetical protein ElyMa_006588700 [Elysia marginata]
MQSKTEDQNIISKSLGLRINSGKSKLLSLGVETKKVIILGTEALEEEVSFTYLGSKIDLKGGTDADVLELERQDQHAHNYKGSGKLEKYLKRSRSDFTILTSNQFCCMVAKFGKPHLEQ